MNVKKYWWILLPAIGIILVMVSPSSEEIPTEISDEVEEVEEVEPNFYLTIPADTLSFEDHTIASGESFGVLLGKRGISTAQIYENCRNRKANF